jgi:hypothetical protein
MPAELNYFVKNRHRIINHSGYIEAKHKMRELMAQKKSEQMGDFVFFDAENKPPINLNDITRKNVGDAVFFTQAGKCPIVDMPSMRGFTREADLSTYAEGNLLLRYNLVGTNAKVVVRVMFTQRTAWNHQIAVYSEKNVEIKAEKAWTTVRIPLSSFGEDEKKFSRVRSILFEVRGEEVTLGFEKVWMEKE